MQGGCRRFDSDRLHPGPWSVPRGLPERSAAPVSKSREPASLRPANARTGAHDHRVERHARPRGGRTGAARRRGRATSAIHREVETPLTPDTVRARTFATERGGYDHLAVDDLVEGIARALEAGRHPGDAAPAEPLPTARRGYRRAEVDAFLAQVAVSPRSDASGAPALPEIRDDPPPSLVDADEVHIPVSPWSRQGLRRATGDRELLLGDGRPLGWSQLDERRAVGPRRQWVVTTDGRPVAWVHVGERRGLAAVPPWEVHLPDGPLLGSVRPPGLRRPQLLMDHAGTELARLELGDGRHDIALLGDGGAPLGHLALGASDGSPDEPYAALSFAPDTSAPIRLLALAFCLGPGGRGGPESSVVVV
ncbi:DivIVA domain-containing protein [Nitriliruptoraceae bacterium ZYF776]|nr:DivIVA domain-containing protein [Profundirhabdus halotolerans]